MDPRDVSHGNGCQPYLNPAAFERPASVRLGTAPRTMEACAGRSTSSLYLSIQKNFKLGERRRIQFRVDS